MATALPLLVFPQARTITPPKGSGFPSSQPHLPAHGKQVVRLSSQLTALQQEFDRYKASVSSSVAGFEPETVLVIEIAGSVDEFRQAIEVIGLEWLGEWDVGDIPPDDDFFERDTKGGRADKAVKGRMFLSLGNEAGMRELLSLWNQWANSQTLPAGKTKWRDVFNQTLKIRRWGIEEALRETGMLDRWRELTNPVNPEEPIRCQIELFYRKSVEKRAQSERNVLALLDAAGGRALSGFVDMQEIAFHAVKVELPADRIRQLLSDLDSDAHDTGIQLFKFHGVMFFRPTGQSLAVTEEGIGVETEIAEGEVYLPPIAAILDGAPNIHHHALKGRLLFDDPDNLSQQYLQGERKHGTAMISVLIKALLVHGAKQDVVASKAITAALKTPKNSRQFKEVMARYLGYGEVEIDRVLACTEQRGTVVGCGEIRENEIHEFRLPLPPGLSSSQVWRRMVVTLAWFSPVNPEHRNFREAKLELSPVGGWGDAPLKLARQDADHNQVMRGTVQHEVVEGSKEVTAYQDGDCILLHVACKKDATARLDDAIPYGLAVTLEIADGVQIPIYEQLRTRLQPQVAVSSA